MPSFKKVVESVAKLVEERNSLETELRLLRDEVCAIAGIIDVAGDGVVTVNFAKLKSHLQNIAIGAGKEE